MTSEISSARAYRLLSEAERHSRFFHLLVINPETDPALRRRALPLATRAFGRMMRRYTIWLEAWGREVKR